MKVRRNDKDNTEYKESKSLCFIIKYWDVSFWKDLRIGYKNSEL